jgi:hypothetical protein
MTIVKYGQEARDLHHKVNIPNYKLHPSFRECRFGKEVWLAFMQIQ